MAIVNSVEDGYVLHVVPSGSPQSVFDIPFPFRIAAEVKVYVDEVLTAATISGEGVATGEGARLAVLAAPVEDVSVEIIREIQPTRTTDFGNIGPFAGSLVDREFDRAFMAMQDLRALSIARTPGITPALTFTPAASTGEVATNIGIGPATIPAATGSLAGLMTSVDKTALEALKVASGVGTTSFTVTPSPTEVLMTGALLGTPTVFPAATVTNAGMMSAADKVALAAAGTGGGGGAGLGSAVAYDTLAQGLADATNPPMFWVNGHTAVGDGGAAWWVKLADVPAVANPTCRPANVNGVHYEILLTNNAFTAPQVGIFPDGVTDQRAALQNCFDFGIQQGIRDDFAASPRFILPGGPTRNGENQPVPFATYLSSGTLYVRRTIEIVGQTGHWRSGSVIRFPPDTAGIVVLYLDQSDPVLTEPQYSGLFCKLVSINLQGNSGVTPILPDANIPDLVGMPQVGEKHGFYIESTCQLIDCSAEMFTGDAFKIDANGAAVADTESDRSIEGAGLQIGIANFARMDNCAGRWCAGAGIRVIGKDANACHFEICHFTRTTGGGLVDESTLGNTYLSCGTAQCTWKVGRKIFGTGPNAARQMYLDGTQATGATWDGDAVDVAGSNAFFTSNTQAEAVARTATIYDEAGTEIFFSTDGTAVRTAAADGGTLLFNLTDNKFRPIWFTAIPRVRHTALASHELGIGADYDDFYQRINSSKPNVVWTEGTLYEKSGCVSSANAAANNVFIATYVEGGIEGWPLLSNGDTILGGGSNSSASGILRLAKNSLGAVINQESIAVVGGFHSAGPWPWRGQVNADGSRWMNGNPNIGAEFGAYSNVARFMSFGDYRDPENSGNDFVDVTFEYAGNSFGSPSGAYEFIHQGRTVITFTTLGFDVHEVDDADPRISPAENITASCSLPYFERGLIMGPRAGKLMTAYRLATPSFTWAPKNATIIFTAAIVGEPAIIRCTLAGKVGVLAYDKLTGLITNTDTRTQTEIDAGYGVAAFACMHAPAPIVQLNQAAYDALVTPDAQTLYCIVE